MRHPIMHVVSISGGKDSTATALVARETVDHDAIRYVFADTGNEHEITYQYLTYLETKIGTIIRLKADFTDWWWQRVAYVRDVYPVKLVDKDGMSPAEADAVVRRILGVMERGPTGNPYLDLCIIKGRFPSRRAQFCTSELKTGPMVEYQLGILDRGEADVVWSWQGIRADESAGRANKPEFEEQGGGICVYRPIIRWKAADTFEAMAAAGVEPNPLYRMAMTRVGCMPCINAAKEEVKEIASRFPEHIDRIEEWEAMVRASSKPNAASFFSSPTSDNRGAIRGNTIRQYVRWSKTMRGGRTQYMFADEPSKACTSSYGLCE